MTIPLFGLAIVVVFVIFIARGRGRAGSTDVTDRDAERVRAELSAMRIADHR
ncbi:hypothetical protein [Nocardia arizonensis]|uniref:hypothetical protein n=1 Tax=Nocardia arizonensis TaxID=1141647 RepID=UPI000B0E855F|nr:hypothetical protein [Nocardia arizonensis]